MDYRDLKRIERWNWKGSRSVSNQRRLGELRVRHPNHSATVIWIVLLLFNSCFTGVSLDGSRDVSGEAKHPSFYLYGF